MIKTVTLKISDIHPYPNNPRNNDNAVDAVVESIKQCGYIAPIIIDENNVILAGHTRYKALKKLGYTEVDVIIKDNLNEQQKRKYRVLDNKTNELAEWDLEMLEKELEGLDFGELDVDWGIEEEEELKVKEDDYDIDEELEKIVEPNAKLGDIYQLGRHRLMCGDSTNTAMVDELVNGELMDLIVTDPPYNVNLGEINKAKVKWAMDRYKGANTDSIENDKMSDEEFVEFLSQAFYNMDRHLNIGRSFYIWHATTTHYEFETAMRKVGWKVRQQLIWNKNSLLLGMSDYQWKHEPCLYGWKEGAAHYFIDDRKQTTTIEIDEDEYKKKNKKELLEILHNIINNISTTVMDENKPKKADLHPTMKPLTLIGRLILNSSRKREKVMDLFGGSGSTLIACEQMERTCYMMEYDPKYVDVIINRWETLTGEKAVKIKERK